MVRLTYEESCRWLQQRQLLAAGTIPPLLYQAPQLTDTTAGVRFFNVEVHDIKLERLTLPYTFISRAEFRDVSWRDSDLANSTANWNDFIHVNFRGANLTNGDWRACVFERVRFDGATLAGVDLRYCGFKQCTFTDADLTDAKLTRRAGTALKLSPEQHSVIDWQAEDGEEPAGG